MGTFWKIKEKIWSLTSSVKHSAQLLATSGLLAMTLSSCDDGQIRVDSEKQEASFSIIYQGHKNGFQDFVSDVVIRKTSDSSFVVEISDPTFFSGEKTIIHQGKDPKKLLEQAAEDINNRVPINTQEGHDRFVAKVREKCNSAAQQYQEMLSRE